jgi:hypothetical protein
MPAACCGFVKAFRPFSVVVKVAESMVRKSEAGALKASSVVMQLAWQT